jgi:hypothetical protein
MLVTASGIDSRLLQAAEAALRGRGGGLTVPQFLRRRCEALLAEAPTSLEEDEALLLLLPGGGGPPGLTPYMRMAVKYRAGKKRVLRSVLGQLEG